MLNLKFDLSGFTVDQIPNTKDSECLSLCIHSCTAKNISYHYMYMYFSPTADMIK